MFYALEWISMDKMLTRMVLMLLIVGMASAGTVTLSGTCIVKNISRGNTVFSLSNSGNDSAYSLILTPIIQGATPTASPYSANILPPQSNVTFALNFTNITEKGVHAAYMLLAYQQGGSVFTATFPCLIPFGNVTVSQVLVAANSSSISNGNLTIKISAFNEGATNITANISLALPPSFTYISQRSYSVDLAPYQEQNTSFSLRLPLYSRQASFGSAAFVTYSKANLSYVSMTKFAVLSAQPSIVTSSLLLVVAAAAVLVVAAFIVLSLWRRKRKRKSG